MKEKIDFPVLRMLSNADQLKIYQLEKLVREWKIVLKFSSKLDPLKDMLIQERRFEDALPIRNLELTILKSIASYLESEFSFNCTYKNKENEEKIRYLPLLSREDLINRCEALLSKTNHQLMT